MTETCSRCGQEVRYGKRNGVTGWLHRENVDHPALFGAIQTPEDIAELERQMDLPRTRMAKGVASHCPTYRALWPLEVYTTREHDLERYRKSKKFRDAEAREQGDVEEEVEELPEPEVVCHPIEPEEFAPRSGIRQIINLAAKQGWERVRLTHARGPYLGSNGKILSISDSIVLGVRDLDSGRFAVASWRDAAFNFAFIGTLGSPARGANSTEMKNWIKGTE